MKLLAARANKRLVDMDDFERAKDNDGFRKTIDGDA